MLRSAVFEPFANPEAEIFLCRRVATASGGAVYPARGTSKEGQGSALDPQRALGPLIP